MQDLILWDKLIKRASRAPFHTNTLVYIYLWGTVKKEKTGSPGKLITGLVKLTIREFLIILVITYQNRECFIHQNSVGKNNYICGKCTQNERLDSVGVNMSSTGPYCLREQIFLPLFRVEENSKRERGDGASVMVGVLHSLRGESVL